MGILSRLNLYSLARKFIFLAFFFSFSVSAGIKETLEKKYPNCIFTEKSKFFTDTEFNKISKKFPEKKVQQFYSFYERNCSKKVSYDFVFSDIVRTKKQVLHVHVVNHKVSDISIVRFEEPAEYKVKRTWLEKFTTTMVDEIDSISGATLSASSTRFLVWLSLYLEKSMLK